MHIIIFLGVNINLMEIMEIVAKCLYILLQSCCKYPLQNLSKTVQDFTVNLYNTSCTHKLAWESVIILIEAQMIVMWNQIEGHQIKAV